VQVVTIITVSFMAGDNLDASMRDMMRLSKELNVAVEATFNDMRLWCTPNFTWMTMLDFNKEAAELLALTEIELLKRGLRK
jgi:hypothetical protein